MSLPNHLRLVEGGPRDLGAARKDIGIFLIGARDATVKFADLYAQARNPKPLSYPRMPARELQRKAPRGTSPKRAAQTDKAAAEVSVTAMCDKLLANAVIESYRVEIL